MADRHYRTMPGCPVEVTLDLIDGRWKGVVLHHLMADECLRFSELHRRLPGITPRLLTKQLRDLEAAGFVARTVYAEVPPRVEYRLTQEGESLRPLIEFAENWGRGRMARAHMDSAEEDAAKGLCLASNAPAEQSTACST